MILSDGTNTREEVARPGPFCDGMAVVLNQVYMDGDFGDRAETDASGGGAAQYGRRILRWDSQGFIGSLTFDTSEQAEAWMSEEFPPEEDEE